MRMESQHAEVDALNGRRFPDTATAGRLGEAEENSKDPGNRRL